MSGPSGSMRLWGWPIVLGALSVVGLLSALLADGAWDALSWFGLGVPVVVAARYGTAGDAMRRRRRSAAK